ncbi:hypothetical protein [Halomonas sp. DN3]|uniref:Uncharacterized protein n=1 Tax=Halomonas sp. RT37 TaxID=2950872 RepID=A0AAU7KIV2_9GAMM|nr:hypothetical protein [Halomonas sp. DN3]USZ50244.1 hypothetical protein NKF27_01630 [Halomonas sp. DN3]
MGLKQYLSITEMPVLFGALLTFSIWVGGQIVERVTSTPFIEYSFSWQENDDYGNWKQQYVTQIHDCMRDPIDEPPPHILNIVLRNLSADQLLDDITIAFRTPVGSGSRVLGTQLISRAPALKKDGAEVCESHYAAVSSVTFHPRWEYVFSVAFTEKELPIVFLDSSSSAVVLEESSIKTRIVRNEVTLLFVGLVASLLLAFLFIWVHWPSTKKAERGGGGE